MAIIKTVFIDGNTGEVIGQADMPAENLPQSFVLATTMHIGDTERYPRMKLVWGDSHYAGTFIEWLKTMLGWTMQPVRALTMPKRGLLVPEGEEIDWEKLFPTGFRPLPKRWVIERSIAWIVRWRRLCRDHEGLPQCSEAFIKLSASARMLAKLAPSLPSSAPS